jgi:hypothetical protein
MIEQLDWLRERLNLLTILLIYSLSLLIVRCVTERVQYHHSIGSKISLNSST